MKDKIKVFLESDALEKYLLGTTSPLETEQVERYIALYPEVRKVYEDLQDGLAAYAKLYAIPAPKALKGNIMGSIRQDNSRKKRSKRLAIAASFVALAFAGSSYFFWNENQSLIQENHVVSSQIKELEADMRQQLEDVRNQFIVLNNPKTRKYTVKGNKKAKQLKAVAYINPVKKLSYINVQELPQLPEDQCYNMWAKVNGEMVNLGPINPSLDKKELLALPYGDNAVGYITVDHKGDNAIPTQENIVANINY